MRPKLLTLQASSVANYQHDPAKVSMHDIARVLQYLLGVCEAKEEDVSAVYCWD